MLIEMLKMTDSTSWTLKRSPTKANRTTNWESSSTLQLAKFQASETASTHDLPVESESSSVQDDAEECQDEPPQDPGPALDEKILPLDQEILEDCDQGRTKTDEAHAEKELHAEKGVHASNPSLLCMRMVMTLQRQTQTLQ